MQIILENKRKYYYIDMLNGFENNSMVFA